MAGESHTTTDHDTIRQWIESRNGAPATVTGTAGSGEDAGILRVEFPDYGSDEKLRRIDWDEFFEKFDEAKLAFLYENETKDGQTSRFSKFIAR